MPTISNFVKDGFNPKQQSKNATHLSAQQHPPHRARSNTISLITSKTTKATAIYNIVCKPAIFPITRSSAATATTHSVLANRKCTSLLPARSAETCSSLARILPCNLSLSAQSLRLSTKTSSCWSWRASNSSLKVAYWARFSRRSCVVSSAIYLSLMSMSTLAS